MTTLAVLRKHKLMTQRDLAAAAGVTPATVNYAEKATKRPTIGVIRRICGALGVHPEDVDEFRRALDIE